MKREHNSNHHVFVDRYGYEWKHTKEGKGNVDVLVFTGGFGNTTETPDTEVFLKFGIAVWRIDHPIADSLDRLITGLNDFISANIRGTLGLFGASFGGAIAQTYLHYYPQNVHFVVISNTSLPASQYKVYLRILWPITKFILEILPSNMAEYLLKKKLYSIIPTEGGDSLRKTIREIKYERLMNTSKLIINYHCDTTLDATHISNWNGHILIMQSDNDPMIPERERKRIFRHYVSAICHIFNEAGHLPRLTAKDEYQRTLHTFIKNNVISS